MFDALADEGVNIQMITTSEIKISVLVDRAARPSPPCGPSTRRSRLDEPPSTRSGPYTPRRAARPRRGQAENGHGAPPRPGMEDLVISGVELDEGQARMTVLDVPDRPGYAAPLFREIAEAGVFVDMIVQSAGTADNTHLSFTVPRAQAERAAEAARRAGPNGSWSSRRSPSSPCWAWACAPTPARPPGCSARWPIAGSTSA